MQRVDPFIPVSTRPNLPKRPLGQPSPKPVARPERPDSKPAASPQGAPKQQITAERERRRLRKLRVPLSALGVIVMGFLIQSLIIGQILIALFAIYALVRRIESRTIFTLALLVTMAIIALLLFGTNTALLTNFAVYTFLLFAVGAVTLGREVLHE